MCILHSSKKKVSLDHSRIFIFLTIQKNLHYGPEFVYCGPFQNVKDLVHSRIPTIWPILLFFFILDQSRNFMFLIIPEYQKQIPHKGRGGSQGGQRLL